MEPKNLVFTIVDISGYTQFIKYHQGSQLHAEAIIFELLEAVLDQAEHPLVLNKLEGDALFLYANLADGEDQAVARDVMRQIQAFFDAFHSRKTELAEESEKCPCPACQRVNDLRLKAFLHKGQAFQRKIRQFEELAGEDVILIHRLLKNSIPATEYIAATQPFADLNGDFFAHDAIEARQEHYPDLGSVDVKVFYPNG